jgi:2,5-dioxopentanoate dehydrogenase
MTNQTINACLKKSEQAFKEYRHISGKQKATFLRAIAEEIENLGDTLINTASRESNGSIAHVRRLRGRRLMGGCHH